MTGESRRVAAHRQRRRGGRDGARDPEIREDRVSVGEENVSWLDVAMNDRLLVGKRERATHLSQNDEDRRERKLSFPRIRARKLSPGMNGVM